MSTEMNFIKHKGLVSEYNEFRQNDPAYLRRKEKHEEWVKNNRDKMVQAQDKYQKNNKEKTLKASSKWQRENKDKVNKYRRERYKAMKSITK